MIDNNDARYAFKWLQDDYMEIEHSFKKEVPVEEELQVEDWLDSNKSLSSISLQSHFKQLQVMKKYLFGNKYNLKESISSNVKLVILLTFC